MMDADLRELYQEQIIFHSKHPRQRRVMEDATARGEGYNALCGDRVTVFVRVRDGHLEEATFEGAACAICMASASLMSESVTGKPLPEVASLEESFIRLVTGKASADELAPTLGKLVVLGGVSQFPIRVKCATLPWRALESALGSSLTADAPVPASA